MRTLLLIITLIAGLLSTAQPFAIGSRQLSFFDVSRNRTIAVEAYYPGTTAGADVSVETGAFPVLVIGHGFVMGVGAYSNLWNYFVPKGYIVLLPTTEGGILPSHGAFGADLAFLADAMQAENALPISPFFEHVAPATALMGHSMGGGASVLGASGNSSIQALVNFAAAETNPSAIAAAADVLVPTMIFAASEDCVAPIAEHQGPIYDALTVPCKAFVNILGGGHCYFAESNFNCTFGELTCGPDLTIDRSEQHDIVNEFAGLWLDHFLKGDQAAYTAVLDSMTTSTRVDAEFTCLSTAVEELTEASWSLQPTVVTDRLLFADLPHGAFVQVIDASGRIVVPAHRFSGAPLDVHSLREGTYHAVVIASGVRSAKPFVVVR